MRPFFRWLFWNFCWLLSLLRYRVRVVGGEQLRGLRGPTLVMPNHPGYIDPPLVLCHLRLPGGIRPTVYAGNYRNPILYPMMRLVDALEVPDLSSHSRDARNRTLAMIDAVVAGLERGDNFLLYPSGRAQRRGIEEIGAARAASEILRRAPAETNIVLVRTRGVFGSSFTYARTGKAPDMVRAALKGIGYTLASLLFFAPRREVTITVERIDRSDLPDLDRETLNRYLESWYNREGREEPSFVPYHWFLGPRSWDFAVAEHRCDVDLEKIRPETIAAVNELIERHLGRPLLAEQRRAETTLDQIGLDSLERMDIALEIEDRFGFRSDHVADTLGEVWALAEGMLGKDAGPLEVPRLWRQPPTGPQTPEVLADTISEALLRRALAHPDDTATADQTSGAISYRKLLVATELMSRRFARMPGRALGILLPASAAADISFFSVLRAGKLPVMLNWTTGPGNLAHAVETLRIERVITSRKLIDRLGIEVPGAEFVFLEDVKQAIGKFEGLRALLATYVMPGRALRRCPQEAPDDPAVVLFTSGSESRPKAVPLTHGNLLANTRASLEVLQATRSDSMLGFLPPFHSFGLLGNIVAPLVAGIRVVHYPDPTDSAALVRMVAAYWTTLLVTTPTFLSYMFSLATNEDLASLRIIITGAEKCPDALFDKAAELAPHAVVLEGYGITECSPVVSGNRPNNIRRGTVGQPLRYVEACVVDPETHEPLPPGETGMLLVRGPSVFSGYLNYDGPDPFLQHDGHRWYVTGDLVAMDEDRFIHFRGRLKRFLKAGGEMISLPALEEPLANKYPPTDSGPQVAVEGIETPTGRRIVLFTTREISLHEANAILADAGFRGLMRLDEVVRVDSIPVLGTGKTDYKVLRKMVAERVQ